MERIPNLEGWFSKLRSEKELNVEDIKLGYEYAMISLNKVVLTIHDELKKEEIFNWLDQSVREIRGVLKNGSLQENELRLNLLDNFESFFKRNFAVDTSTYRKPLVWNGEKGALAEIFMLLKNLKTKEGKPFLGNSIEDIALFLKSNFDVYKETELSTIQGTLKKIPSKIAHNENKVKINITG